MDSSVISYATMEESDWPLRTPRLTLSPASSNESLDIPMPGTPDLEPTEAEPMLLPGFHFSTTDNNVDPAEFHRIAAQLLSGEVDKRDSAQYMADEQEDQQPIQERHLHCDLGRDPSGRYCCSCGKSYSTGLRLYEHTQQCAGASNYPCMTCDKVFSTKEKLDRHVSTRHNSNREACPECGKMFPASYLPKHLASGLGGCDGMVQISSSPAIDPVHQNPMRKSMSQQYWIYGGDHSWQTQSRESNDSGYESDEPEVTDRTMEFVKQLLRRPGSRMDRISCDLCGETFSSRDDALALHMGEHSLDFTEKRHKCDECRIYFANEKDLDRHLQSSNLNQHCGFTFHHNTPCSGHHPPTYFKSSVTNDHNLMQKHLWAWELCQLRSHRVTVARILAEKLTSMNPNRQMSLQDCKRTYASMLPHFSMATSQRESNWIDNDQHLANLDSHFSQVLDEVYPETVKQVDQRPDSAIIAVRPEGGKRLSKRKSLIDLAKRKTVEEKIKHGHKRHALSASGFALLRQQVAKDQSRPSSLPVAARTMMVA